MWSRPLDGGTEVPLAVGKNVYVATKSCSVYALAPDDGHELWKYTIEGTTTYLVKNGNVL